MNYTQEKFFLGIATLFSSGISALGAIMATNESIRYIYLTLSVCIITAAFLALVFRRPNETMRTVVGRCGLAILMGVFGTRILMYHIDLGLAKDDMVYLLGIAAGVTIAGFLVGVVLLQIIDRRSNAIANSILNRVLRPDSPEKKQNDDS